jgi:hypothetical protein
MWRVAGVAIDNAGDCWASAIDTKSRAHLIYYAGCTGNGAVASGFKNKSYGGLDFDSKGNLVSIDFENHRVFVYSGCNPKCGLVAGPLALRGGGIYGKVNAAGTLFATADYTSASIDVYKYDGKSLKFDYSFNRDLNPSASAEGIAFSPSD